MRLREATLIFGLVCAVPACTSLGLSSTGPVHLAPLSESSDDSWKKTLTESTRRVEVYEAGVRQADLRATLVTPRLRRAFLASRAGFHGRFSQEAERDLIALGNPDEGVDEKMKSKPDAEEQVLVFVAMYVSDQKDRDLAASYTIWDSQLVRGDARAAPIKMETLRLSPAVSAMFPYVDRFDDVYLMRFPLMDVQGHPFLSSGGAPLRLEVKSVLANATVEWTLSD